MPGESYCRQIRSLLLYLVVVLRISSANELLCDADGCIPLTILVDVCRCCRLLMFISLPLLETLSLL